MAQAFNLQIQPTLKTKDMKIINGIAAFIENTDVVRYELEKRALRAAKAVAPERSGGLKKAIEISNSTPLGYTLGVSDNILSGEAATKKTEVMSGYASKRYVDEGKLPASMRPRYIPLPSKFSDDDEDDLFAEKSPEEYAKDMERYYAAVKAEQERVQNARNKVRFIKSTKTTSFMKGKKYREYMDGGGKVRANMQEFGYPYRAGIWGPYKPNPKAPKGPRGLGYLRLGQVLAVKSLLRDYIDYSVNVTPQEVIYYERTIQTELERLYPKFLAKFLRQQKLPPYFKGVDKLKQKAPIPERALAYGNITNFEIDLPLTFPRNPYSLFETGGKLAGIRTSVNERPFQPGFSFLIDDE